MLKSLSKFLLAVAPVVAYQLGSVWLWGEVEVPECMKDNKK